MSAAAIIDELRRSRQAACRCSRSIRRPVTPLPSPRRDDPRAPISAVRSIVRRQAITPRPAAAPHGQTLGSRAASPASAHALTRLIGRHIFLPTDTSEHRRLHADAERKDVACPRPASPCRTRIDHLSILDETRRAGRSPRTGDRPERSCCGCTATMLLARRFDERLLSLQRQGRIGTFPPISGQEAAHLGAVGRAAAVGLGRAGLPRDGGGHLARPAAGEHHRLQQRLQRRRPHPRRPQRHAHLRPGGLPDPARGRASPGP
ncbi:MAG: hypothetical protein MZV70_68095 [Desulfobacterales bacterium]|nr:hypothetical protein [Desulfobacterales bacterium]